MNGCFSDQQNKEEAKVIAQAVREHFQKHPDETLGVVAMSAKQRDQIKNEIEMLAQKDSLFADQLDKDAKKSEPLFVKNLENVQGDKRDVIFISITYGPKRPGEKVSLLSEPINSEHGGRCLKELRTLPKNLMRVFSSMDSGDILVGQDAKRGVRDLRDFLKDCETGESATANKDKIKDNTLTETIAQGVFKYLNDLESNRAAYESRWIYELLQNARDAAAGKATSLTASVEYQEGKLTFLHNGSGFTNDQVAHLIYHGSTKFEIEGTIGQFGSGFLSTHLLSSKIDVSGFLNDGQSFEFRLERETGSIQSLVALMDKAWEDFNPSDKPLTVAMPNEFTTRFAYPISKEASEVVAEGIANLKQCAPFVVVFNHEFSAINIESADSTTKFEVTERKLLEKDGPQLVTVAETDGGIHRERKYLLAQSEKDSVAIPLSVSESSSICLPLNDIPRLFLGFPLVGTENFSFPAVINSFRFAPTEPRDGIFLWRSQGVENAANQENQAVIGEACQLLVDMLQFVALRGWRNAYRLAEIPNIQHQNWLNENKLRDFLKEKLSERIRQTPAVLNEAGEAIPPKESEIPIATTPEGVLSLWDLLVQWQKDKDIWPRRDEVAGWCDAVKSWARLSNSDSDPLTFDEVIDGRKSASIVDDVSHDPSADPRTHRVSRLVNSLKENISAINWLDQLISFLRANGQGDAVSEYRIVPSQAGFLHKLPELHRDVGISEELKTVAGLLEWRIKPELRDTRITSLSEESGAGDWDNDYVLGELIRKLQDRAEKSPDAAFMQSSVRLFTWIAEHKKWDLLRGFPVFSDEPPAQQRVIKLDRSVEDDVRPLAPVSAWPQDLQPFSELFPSRYTLANAFSKDVSDSKVWEVLEADGFVRRDVVITRKTHVDFNTFPPDEPLTDGEHKTLEVVSITDVAFLTRKDIGIMARVRQSQSLAQRFWQFLTKWLIVRDSGGLEPKEAACDCEEKETHHYYSAEWLVPLVRNKWVPFSAEGSRGACKADAQSLANLLRGSGWTPASLADSPATVKLLEAIGVTQFDLTRSFMASTDKERADQEKEFTRILTSTGGNLKPVSEFVEDLKHDSELLDHLAKRRKNRQIVRDNQCLGKQVEELVKEVLEKELGEERFTVRNTGVGSDLAIEDLATLEINKPGRRWLVEVKATRSQEVRMTATQAKTAVREFQEKKRFFLCVVPVSGEMRFVPDIGARLVDLCKDLDSLQNQRNKITAGDSNGVQLKVEDGAAWVRIASSVWQNEGFPLDELPDHLN